MSATLAAGLDALQALFGALELSPVYDSAAIGFDGQPFLNMVVAVDTTLPLATMAARLRQIETAPRTPGERDPLFRATPGHRYPHLRRARGRTPWHQPASRRNSR